MENTFNNTHLTALPQTNHITLSSGHPHFGGLDLHFVVEYFQRNENETRISRKYCEFPGNVSTFKLVVVST